MGTERTVPWTRPTEFLTRVHSFWKDLAKISQFWIFGPPQIHVGKVRLFVKIFSESTSVVSFEKWGREVVAMAFDRNEMIALCTATEPACPNAFQINSSGIYFFQIICGIGRHISRPYTHIFFTAKFNKLLPLEDRLCISTHLSPNRSFRPIFVGILRT